MRVATGAAGAMVLGLGSASASTAAPTAVAGAGRFGPDFAQWEGAAGLSSYFAKLAEHLNRYEAQFRSAEAKLDERCTPEFVALADDSDPDVSNRFYFDPVVVRYLDVRALVYYSLRDALKPKVESIDDCAFQEDCERAFGKLMDPKIVAYEDAIDGAIRRHARDLVRAQGDDRLVREADARFQIGLKRRAQALRQRSPGVLSFAC